MTDEQRAREWLLPLLQDMVAKVLSDRTVLKEQQQIIEQTAALLASRALEARLEQHEEDCHHCFTIKVHHPEWAPSKCPTATKLRAALEQAAAGGGQ